MSDFGWTVKRRGLRRPAQGPPKSDIRNPLIETARSIGCCFTGIGSYHINDFQIAGDQTVGTIVLHYDLYRASPNDPAFDPTIDTLAVGQTVSAPSSVTVTAVPEPGTGTLVGSDWVCVGSRRAED